MKTTPKWTGHVIEVDIDVTRRKRFHYLLAPNGEVLGTHRQVGPLLEQLRTLEIERVLVLSESSAYVLELQGMDALHPRNGGVVEATAPILRLLNHG